MFLKSRLIKIFFCLILVFSIVSTTVFCCSAFNQGFGSGYEADDGDFFGQISNYKISPYSTGSWSDYDAVLRDQYHVFAGWSYRFKVIPFNAVPTTDTVSSDGDFSNPVYLPYFTTDYVISLNNLTYENSSFPSYGSTDIDVGVFDGGEGYNNSLASYESNLTLSSGVSSGDTSFSIFSVDDIPFGYRGSYCGRLLFADYDDVICDPLFSTYDVLDSNSIHLTGSSYALDITIDYRYKIVGHSDFTSGSYTLSYDFSKEYLPVISFGSFLYNVLGESLIDYKPDYISDHTFWTAFDGFDPLDPYPVGSDDYNILFSGCPQIFFDYFSFSALPRLGFYFNACPWDSYVISSPFFGAGTSKSFDVPLCSDCSYEDGLEYFYLNDGTSSSGGTPDTPDWLHLSLGWLSDAVGGILSVEFVPFITFGSIVVIILAFSVVMWWLKVFGGG